MTNEQFWKKLDRITSKKQTPKTTQEFVEVFYDGFKHELGIMICAIMKDKDADNAKQAYVQTDIGRAMLFYTDKRHVNKSDDMFISFEGPRTIECVTVSFGEILANLMQKEEMIILVFNKGTDHMYTIPLQLLEMTILKNWNY